MTDLNVGLEWSNDSLGEEMTARTRGSNNSGNPFQSRNDTYDDSGNLSNLSKAWSLSVLLFLVIVGRLSYGSCCLTRSSAISPEFHRNSPDSLEVNLR